MKFKIFFCCDKTHRLFLYNFILIYSHTTRRWYWASRMCFYLQLMSVSYCSLVYILVLFLRWIHTKSMKTKSKIVSRKKIVLFVIAEEWKATWNDLIFLVEESFSHKVTTPPSRTHTKTTKGIESSEVRAAPPKTEWERDTMKDYIHHFPFICRWIIPNKLFLFGVVSMPMRWETNV